MAISVVWDSQEHSAILMTFDSRWTWEEFYQAVADGRSLMDGVNHKVDLILDLRDSIFAPDGAVWRFRVVAAGGRHPNRGALVWVGASSAIRAMFGIIRRVYRTMFADEAVLFAATPESARALLKERQS